MDTLKIGNATHLFKIENMERRLLVLDLLQKLKNIERESYLKVARNSIRFMTVSFGRLMTFFHKIHGYGNES